MAGMGRGAIGRRLKSRQYVLLHRAVYLIDPPSADEWTATMAAILRFAGDAVAGGLSAGALWGMLDGLPAVPNLTLAGRGAHAHPGLRVHRVAQLERRDVRWRNGIPVTSPARTVIDLAGGVALLEFESALAVCLGQRLATEAQIRRAMERVPVRTPGLGVLRRLLDQGGFARTRSHYERRLLALIEEARLPRPLTNHRLHGHEVDMVWLDRKLVLEFDGWKFHSDRRSFENDRRRDQDLVVAGYRIIRVTARQVEREPLALIARLAAALSV